MTQLTIAQAMQIALQHHQAGRLAEAEQLYLQILATQPDIVEVLHLLGTLTAQTGRPQMAVELIRRAIAFKQNWPEAWSDLGNVLREVGQLPDALEAHQRAITLKPDYAEAYSNLATVLMDLGRLDEAIAACQKAADLKPGFTEAFFNLGTALRENGRIDEAVAAHRRAVEINSDSADAQWNLGVSLLHAGKFQEGWSKFQWRFDEFLARRPFPQPKWQGEDLRGKTILLRSDPCGFGDVLQFVRYAALVADRGGRVILECQAELKSLLKNSPGVEQVIAVNESPPPFDVQCFLLSLPIIFRTEWNSIPANVPYVKSDAELVESWRRKLGPKRRSKRVGLVWAGGPTALFRNARSRSMTLAHLAPLANVADVEFYSLQKGEAAKEAPPTGLNLIDFTSELTDFAQTAALMENLDLIITIDTSIAHLAGAMGKRGWVILPFVADWRWLRDREDNPWYPTLRLFRQPAVGDWAGAIEHVLTELQRT